MHEVGVAQGILDVLESNARAHGEGRILSVRLRIGEMSGVEIESLKFALEVLAQGTRAEGMAVEVVRASGTGRCKACGKDWTFRLGDTACPHCGSGDVSLEGGNELLVESFDME